VIEKMERETGVERATSRLGIWTAIENKDNGAHDDECTPKQISNFRNAFCSHMLNGVEVEWRIDRALKSIIHNGGRDMVEEKQGGEGEFPDPKGMQGWLEGEIERIQKASELRIKEATRFVNEYGRGEISADQAAERSFEYANRWGDALPGIGGTRGVSDEEILRKLDEAQVMQGAVDKHVLSRRRGGTPETAR